MRDHRAPRLPGSRILRLARILLNEQDVERFVSPAVADLQHEWGLAGQRPTREWRAIRWSARARLLAMLVALSGRARLRATVRVPWYPLFPVMLAVGYGVWSMKRGGISGSVVAAQWAWLVLSVAIAWAIATSPKRLVESMAAAGGYLAVGALAATAFFGDSMDGASRWWRVGPLTIQVSNLVLPSFILGLTSLLARGSMVGAALLATGAELGLIAQPDGGAAVVFGAATVGIMLGVGSVRASRIGGAAIALVLGAMWALERDPSLPSVLHVENIFQLVAMAGVPVTICAIASLALVAVYPLSRLSHTPRKDATVRGVAAGVAASFSTSVLLPAFGAYPVPLIGYGGSSVVTAMTGLALILALDAEPSGGFSQWDESSTKSRGSGSKTGAS